MILESQTKLMGSKGINARKKDPKILIVDLSKNYGGSTTRVLSILKKIPSQNIALAGLETSPVTEEARKAGVKVFPVARHKSDPRILVKLIQVIKENEFQVLDTQNVQSKFWGSLAAVFTQTALVSTIHSWYAHEQMGSFRGRAYTFLELHTNKKLTHYITVSRKDRDLLVNSGISPEQVTLIHNSVSIEIDKIPDQRKALIEKFDMPSDAIICGAVGRLVPVKGYDLFIKAFQIVAEENPRVYGLIIGDGELYSTLLDLIKRLGLVDRFHLIGFHQRENVLSILKSCDIFLMPSYSEGTPIALLEAGMLGKAVVASDVGGIPELVKNHEDAILTPPGDYHAIARVLLDLCLDPKKIVILGTNIRERFREDFNQENMIAATQRVYTIAWQQSSALKN